MTYKWKLPGLVPVDPQTAGAELSRIYEAAGSLTPKAVVQASRDESAPLHHCFEWDDTKAAEKYRESQAGEIIRALVVVEEPEERAPTRVRAFHHIERDYQPLSVIVNSPSMMEHLLRDAIRELESFRLKYNNLKELSQVFKVIDELKGDHTT